ncbi:TonB-dependent receptor [Stenotrophobium rhamnosiphilum]|uniref:TonB-dependent receptor n=2 Tax=Stenotrophobium rhamnosiphilum TaxID=2029166 RepID=A0A2T5MIS8_9GAMM|nr:TonB-dependent receptor [Stenotrophobium rhamnosiphilum]
MAYCCIATAIANPVLAFAQQEQTASNEAAAPAASSKASDTDFLTELLATPEQPAQESNTSATPATETATTSPAPASEEKPAEASVEAQASEPSAAATADVTESLDLIGVKKPAENSVAAAPIRGRQIDEIVVTATKREENLRDIPASISAFTGEKLENEGKLSLNDFIQQSPGVTAAQGNAGFTRITMRGISTDTSPAAATPSPVGIFIGDVSFSDPYTANIVPDLSAFDLSGVEILKGPQGTLFGGSALSGAVRYQLQEPVQGEWQFRAFSQYNHPDDGGQAFTTGGAVNIPLLTDHNLALRFVYVDRHYPGVYDNGRTGEKDIDHASGNQIRGILLWEPSENWKFKYTHLFQKSNTPQATFTADTPNGPRSNSSKILDTPSDNHFSMDNLEMNYNFESMRLVSQTARVVKDALFYGDYTAALFGNPPQGYPAALAASSEVIDKSKAFSQEIRLQSTDDDAFKWLVGAYYFDYDGYFNLHIDTPATTGLLGPGSLINTIAGLLGVPGQFINENTSLLNGESISSSKEIAIFTDLNYNLWDRLDLSVGARFYSTKVTGGYVGTGILILAENNLSPTNTIGDLKERGINPKFSATYHFSDEISLYGMAAKGFRFGGVSSVPSTASNGVPPTFKSDTLWNYELGLRTSWLEDTLHADITGFYLFYKNPIITQATTGVIPLSYSDNVSSAISRGLELSLLWNPPVDGLSMSFNGGMTDAHITAPFEAANGDQVQPGQEMPGAARFQYNSSVQYLRPVSFFLVGANAGYTYVGKGYNNLTHDVEINGFGTLSAGLTFASDALSFKPKIAINLSNILNVTAATAGAIGKSIVTQSKTEQYALNPPRTITVRVSFDL